MRNEAIMNALQNPNFGVSLPPLSPDAKFLIGLTVADQDNSRVIALASQRDPVFAARLLSAANSEEYSQLELTTSTLVAVRRLGSRVSYGLILTVSLHSGFKHLLKSEVHQGIILRKTLVMTSTARRVAIWANVPETTAAILWLSCLLYSLGIYAGLLYGGVLTAQFIKGLDSARDEFTNFSNIEELCGFEHISAKLAEAWGMDERVVNALMDDGLDNPRTQDGRLLSGVIDLVSAKGLGQDETPILKELQHMGVLPDDDPNSSRASLTSQLP